jgi:hypothetical protein
MGVKFTRKALYFNVVIFIFFLIGCEKTVLEDDIEISYSMQTINNVHITGSYVFDSLSDLLNFKANNNLDELDITSYGDIFFEDNALTIIVYDEEETFVYPEKIIYINNNLKVSMIRTNESLENKTCFLLVEIGEKQMLTPEQISHTIRDAVITNGLVPFTYERYNSQNDFAFEDWEHMSAFENNFHIINNTRSFTNFCFTYEHMLPSTESILNNVFFETHTLLIIQFWAGAYYGDGVIIDNILIEDHQATITTKITNAFGERDQTIYSFWIIIAKNENITSITHLVIF